MEAGLFSNFHSLMSLKDESLAQLSHSEESDLIENRSLLRGLDSQTEQINDSMSQWMFFFLLHNVRVVTQQNVDVEAQRLMGSCGKEMDG